MAQSPMISCPLKQTDEIDWVQPLKAHIRSAYGDDPERYAEECATLNRLRQDMRGAGKDSAAGRDLLYRYYGQLELLDLRFPVDENHIQISFTWYDAFTTKPTSQFSLAFEKASIIFNISAILSCHAANQNRSDESGLKTAYHSFQAAAGMFTYINDNFLHAPSLDLSREAVKTLVSITLAQAQETFLEKQVTDGKKPGLLAKLAAQAQMLYLQAVEGCQDSVGKGIFDRSWCQVLQTKAAHAAALSEYYQALADEQSNSHGTAIARLQLAEKSSKASCSFAKSVPSSPPVDSNLSSETASTLVQLTKRHLENVQEKLATLVKDNDYIYHQTVPAEASLTPVSKLPVAKAIPVSELYQGQDIQKIIGPDIFQRLVPMAVTEQASMYDEEKAKLARSEAEKVETANGEMAASLDYLKLPQSLDILKGGVDQELTVEDEFRQWCEDLAGHESFSAIFDHLQQEKGAILSSLSNSSKQLDMEGSVCEKMRSKYGSDWTQQPSSRLTSVFRSDLRGHRETLDEAENTDSQLLTSARQYEKDFEEIRSAGESDEADILFQRALIKAGLGKGRNQSGKGSPTTANAENTLLDEDYGEGGPTVMDQIARVEEVLKKLNLIKRERGQVLKDLKERIRTDDISNVLILNKKSIMNQENQLFQAELEKFRSHQNRLLSTVHKQQSLLRELTKTYGDLLQDKRVRSDQQKYEAINRSRAAVMSRYRRIFQIFQELREGLQRAERFYSEMKETVENIGKNVDGFVNNRRAEGAQLLNQIEQNKASSASSQATAERDRLQQLMERMSMEPSRDSSSPAPPSAALYQNIRSSPVPTQYHPANQDPRFTIPPQKTPRPVEGHLYHERSLTPNAFHDSSRQPQQMSSAPKSSQGYASAQQPPSHAFSQGAALPLSEGYHPMAYPYQTPNAPNPPQNPHPFSPISTAPQTGSALYPPRLPNSSSSQQHHQPPPPPPSVPPAMPSAHQQQQQQRQQQQQQPQYSQYNHFHTNPAATPGLPAQQTHYVPPPPPKHPPGSMTTYPPMPGPMPGGPGGYAQIGREPPGLKRPQQYQQQQGQPGQQGQQGYGQVQQGGGDPWAGLNAWR